MPFMIKFNLSNIQHACLVCFCSSKKCFNSCNKLHYRKRLLNIIVSTILKSLSKKEDLAKTVVDDWRQFF